MDRKLAARLARYCELAYEPAAVVRAALPDASVSFFDHDDTQAYLIERESERVVAFRGTQVISGFSFADVLSNLWVGREPWRRGRVHGGYREALLDIMEDAKRPLSSGFRPLYLTGHSMGGALATLASTLPPGPTASYSFGAPRVGDGMFARSLRHVMRIVHADDIAARYPLPFGYRHGGTAWHLHRDGSLTPGLSLAWHLRVPLTAGSFARAVLDHRIGEYVRKLGQSPQVFPT